MTFTEMGGHPGDNRGFLHKSKFGKFVGGAIKTFVPGVSTAVNVVGTARNLLGGGGGGGRSFGRGARSPGARPTTPRALTARTTVFSAAEKEAGRALKFSGNGAGTALISGSQFHGGFGNGGPCDFPLQRNPDGTCTEATVDQFGRPLGVGEAVMGRYGAALEPGSKIINRAICLRGMQLGDDGLCYNKSQITNKQRMWPAGRKPLLSGGDMRAISIAARAGRRLEGTTKRLQRLGMMKKATPRRIAPHQHAKASTAVVSV